MSVSLRKRIHLLVRGLLDSYPGAWMVWCDPRGDWEPLLPRVAGDSRMGGFALLPVSERTAGALGGPLVRRQLQERLDANESLVLYTTVAPEDLGWLAAQALLAESVYSQGLREQLREWGWRPQKLTIGDDELAAMARQNLDKDPADWGAGGLQADKSLLVEMLAGGPLPAPERMLELDITVEQAGLPQFDSEDIARWRTRALARLLATQAQQTAPALLSEGHDLVIPAGRRALALQVLDDWRDSRRLGKTLPEAILGADRVADLAAQLGDAGVEVGPFFSQVAEANVFATTCRRLAQLSGRELVESLARSGAAIEQHELGFWGKECEHRAALPWGELTRLSRAAQMLLDAAPAERWANPQAAIDWYTSKGWRVDQAGEELLRTMDRSTPELLALITPLRAAYRARWEHYMMRWSEVWSGAGCPIPPLGSAGECLRELLRVPRPTVVLVIDALRYGLGASLAEQLNRREAAERASVVPARAPLPSITALGMGMALPIPAAELRADIVDGKWQLQRGESQENLSAAAQRRAWWQRYGEVREEGLLTMADVLAGHIPPPSQERKRLVIYDDTIDKLGHDDELEALGSSPALDRYLNAIERLRDAKWLRILIVTDHGYIHWAGSEEKSVPLPAPDPAYASRRALAYPAQQTLSGPQGLAPGGHWRIAVPHGAASFRTYGGLGYFHGGASLQEWIIPCVKIEWPLVAKPLGVTIQPIDQVISQLPRVILEVVHGSLFTDDDIPRRVDVLIRDPGRNILFRSEQFTITPDQHEVSVQLGVETDAVAERGTTLRVEVRDTRTEEIIASASSILKIDLTGW